MVPLESRSRFHWSSSDEAAFFKQQTGIEDDDALKVHLLTIHAEAYKVYPYNCIRRWSWAKLKICRLPPYQDLLKIGRERKGAIFLDVGCCLGNDARKVIADGYPIEQVVTSDVHSEFWDIGHALFTTSPENFPVTFVPGDVFDSKHLDIVTPFTSETPPATQVPNLRGLESLNPLRGHVSAIHASSLFHLFQEEAQSHLARALAGLLSPEPGSVIFGQHCALPKAGAGEGPGSRRPIFCHSPDSWSELWDGSICVQGTVEVQTDLAEMPGKEVSEMFADGKAHGPMYLLTWSVTRL
ncbi:hypothetical protein BC834DRAFT_43900 [Gloeopeniophorella convolvens]|nr:hypothetical protein BC834DRAFT_43900 [Gloeopeniophorella convolvens]